MLDASHGGIPAFADLFRYQLLHDLGGWWVDTDVYCLTPDLPAVDYAWAEEEPGQLNNAILKLPAGDPLAARLRDLARERSSQPGRWGALGPALLTEVILGAGHAPILSSSACYPLHWLEAHYTWLPERRNEVESRLRGAGFLHLWMKALTDCGIDLYRKAPAGSWLEAACREEPWPSRNLPWAEWRTRRAVRRYHQTPSVRARLDHVVRRRANG
jgi:hypothetical protein